MIWLAVILVDARIKVILDGLIFLLHREISGGDTAYTEKINYAVNIKVINKMGVC